MCHDNEKWYKSGRGLDLPVKNWHEEFDKFWPEHSEISKICSLMDCFWPKYIMFELKMCRGVMFDGTEYWCQIWKKTDLCFQKSHDEFNKFSPEHVRKSKNWDFDGILLSKVENVGELCVMTIKNYAKIEGELTCQFKIDMRNLTNFDPSTQKSQKFAF